ncbi:site-specific integrase [Stenotrophomonas maltophilia]|uniref:site-specific integrase n=1 Tax=Stenotrophomonas maltophilia TaxID=40324 RepID=UPI00066B1676|nr:site-specific integrase [Stenotrophomonas maltophilia]ELK2668564.1 site-specific integrase [Stenotrophomonas maltophilia]KUJ01542.1 hypothetical protein AR275_13835 [Stenotrophomonas maltophilia]MBH1376295.1 site-specific integrase [Stenotrophomonas maltophilia]MBH1439602.1 site-specific integrase [Stenotrophomonas maltophilia]MBH1558589.1 site-specific integrase [Stenotrophomonas maltophilia]
MPKPYILARPSGLFARYLVPADLRPVVGSRFVVRALHAKGDRARLVAALMAVALSQAFDALRQGEPMADDLLKKALGALVDGRIRPWEVEINGHRVNVPDHPDPDTNYRRMTETMARLEALPPRAAAADPIKPLRAVLTLKEAAEKHLADLRAVGRKPRTVMDSEHSLRLMAGLLGEDKPVAEIDTDDIRAVRDGIARWPSNASKRKEFRGLSVKGVILLAAAMEEPGPEARTMKKHKQRLSKFFNDLRKQDKIDRNPLHGVDFAPDGDTEESGGRPFTADELRTIFEPIRFKSWASKYPHRWFGPMLGLYSGARVNEVAQLLAKDIEQVEGVWGFHVRAVAAENQSIKNPKTKRFVPIARAVLDAGLLDYIEDLKASGHRRLFPNLPFKTDGGYGAALSKQFSAYIKNKCGIEERGLGFHAFRHYVASELARLDADLVEIAPLTGHALPESILAKFYIHKHLADKVKTVAKLAPPVKLPGYERDQFRRAFRAAPVEQPPSKATKKAAKKVGAKKAATE